MTPEQKVVVITRASRGINTIPGTGILRHLKLATSTIPIVAVTADPVTLGLVQSLARPGGNITGVTADAGFEIPRPYATIAA